jgi:hypothetical protein
MNDLSKIRTRLDALLASPDTNERSRACPNPDCWHDLMPCHECMSSFSGRLAQAEQAKREFARHGAAAVMLLLPVVETLVSDGGEAALARLEGELELLRRRDRARIATSPL